MFAKADAKVAGHTESLVGAGTVVAGDIVFSGGLRIDGEVTGEVRARDGQAGTLVIGEQGRVHGRIKVARLIVSGLVSGGAEATEFVRLQAKARVQGDLVYAAAEIHGGAVVQGRLLPRQLAAADDLDGARLRAVATA